MILDEAQLKLRALREMIDASCTSDAECAVTREPAVMCASTAVCPQTIAMSTESLEVLSVGLETLNAEQCTEAAEQECEIVYPTINCPHDTAPYEARCIESSCRPIRLLEEGVCEFSLPVGAAAPWIGSFEGSLQLEQTFDGETKFKDVVVNLTFGEYLLPERHLPALGYASDDWRAYASGGGESLSLHPLFAQQGVGTAWVYDQTEADGPANELVFSQSCATFADWSITWQYDVTYALTDLVDYELYGYTNPDAPVVTMNARENYTLDADDQLVVDARSTGLVDGEPVSFEMTGILTRIE